MSDRMGMQTNSDSEPTPGHAFSDDDTSLDLEPKPEAILEDAGADDPAEAEPLVHPSELAPPKVRAPPITSFTTRSTATSTAWG